MIGWATCGAGWDDHNFCYSIMDCLSASFSSSGFSALSIRQVFSTLHLVAESSRRAALLHPSVNLHWTSSSSLSTFFGPRCLFPPFALRCLSPLVDQKPHSPAFLFSQLSLPIKLIHEFISDQTISLALALHPTQSNAVGLGSSISLSFSKAAQDATLCIFHYL